MYPNNKNRQIFYFHERNISREINSSENALNKLKSELIEIKEFHLPFENSVRSLVLIRKVKKQIKCILEEWKKSRKTIIK